MPHVDRYGTYTTVLMITLSGQKYQPSNDIAINRLHHLSSIGTRSSNMSSNGVSLVTSGSDDGNSRVVPIGESCGRVMASNIRIKHIELHTVTNRRQMDNMSNDITMYNYTVDGHLMFVESRVGDDGACNPGQRPH
jgi:hypothetical protein